MKIVKSIGDRLVVDCLLAGGVVVLRTDTLYGLLAQADNEVAVERIYQLKSRDKTKSSVVLLADSSQAFDPMPLSVEQAYGQNWPEQTTIVLPSKQAPAWIQRGNSSVAYRVPAVNDLRQLLALTGRLVAPSANPQGQAPAETIEQAIDYFGEAVDVYVDGGPVKSQNPSQILKLHEDGDIERIR